MGNKSDNPAGVFRRALPRTGVLLLVVLLVLGGVLGGCSSNKKAPVYDRNTHGEYKRVKVTQYKVRKGDTLYAVAWKAGVDYRTLAKWNGLKSPYTIYPGQQLRLKAPAAHQKKKSTARKSSRNNKKKSSPKSVSKTTTTQRKTSSKKPVPTAKEQKAGANKSMRWSWPTRGKVISRYAKGDATKKGIRIGGTKGQEISAAEAGKVVYVGSGLIGYGRLIIVKHNDKYLSAYAHNSRLLVKEGDQVQRGEHIADMGVANTGKPMLHFEIRRYGKPIDPISLLPR